MQATRLNRLRSSTVHYFPRHVQRLSLATPFSDFSAGPGVVPGRAATEPSVYLPTTSIHVQQPQQQQNEPPVPKDHDGATAHGTVRASRSRFRRPPQSGWKDPHDIRQAFRPKDGGLGVLKESSESQGEESVSISPDPQRRSNMRKSKETRNMSPELLQQVQNFSFDMSNHEYGPFLRLANVTPKKWVCGKLVSSGPWRTKINPLALLIINKTRQKAWLEMRLLSKTAKRIITVDHVAFYLWALRFAQVTQLHTGGEASWMDDWKCLHDLDTVDEMRDAWAKFGSKEQARKWHTAILSTLHHCPDKAHLVLEATMDPAPPFYAVADSLILIWRHFHSLKLSSPREQNAIADGILRLLGKILDTYPPSHISFWQDVMTPFSQVLPCRQVADLWDMLQHFKPRHKTQRSLLFASKLASDPTYKQKAFDILKPLVQGRVSRSSRFRHEFSQTVTTLLDGKPTNEELSNGKDESAFSYEDALEYLMREGYKPNLINFTSFIGTLLWHGQTGQALHLARLFSQEGSKTELDAKAFNVIMRGAKQSLQADNVQQALDLAKVSSADRVDVLNNALHSIFVFADADSRHSGARAPWTLPLFLPMLRIYAKQFSLGPLQDWIPDALPLYLEQAPLKPVSVKLADGRESSWEFPHTIVPVIDDFFSQTDNQQLQPNSVTIGLMLRAYIKTLRNIHDLVDYYDFLKPKLENDGPLRPPARSLMTSQGTIIHDTIIQALMEKRGGRGLSQPAMRVMGDMLRNKPSALGADELRPLHPAPSVFTFHILLRGLFSRGDRILATQILEIMREMRIPVILPTYNLLIKHHAKQQDVYQTVQTLQDLEMEGLQPNDATYQAFGLLQDQDKALDMMDRIIESNKGPVAKGLAV
ncbi:hypothetical protein S40288_06556 [Stachybotrys chartarum IBT 40288]|nr:hypothetical protein S40288_06556 [Stachybotrys chartarum IBT 40288]